MCACHGTTICPDEIFLGYENDVPIYVRRDSQEGTAEIARRTTPPLPHPTDIAAMREAAAQAVDPGCKRPCDCDVCYCINIGDAQSVAIWDSETENAKRIRAIPLPVAQPDTRRSEAEIRAEIARLEAQLQEYPGDTAVIGFLAGICWVLNEQETGR